MVGIVLLRTAAWHNKHIDAHKELKLTATPGSRRSASAMTHHLVIQDLCILMLKQIGVASRGVGGMATT